MSDATDRLRAIPGLQFVRNSQGEVAAVQIPAPTADAMLDVIEAAEDFCDGPMSEGAICDALARFREVADE